MKSLFLKLKNKFWWGWLFFWIILIMYFLIWLFNFNLFINAWKDFLNVLINEILLVLIIVFIFMFILNILLEKENIKDKIKKSKSSTKYIISIIWWILSTWPSYMWYPFLKQLNDNWLNYGHISTFMYARAVKIQFLLVMIFYFWLKYTIIFNIVLIFLSFISWILINLIFRSLNYEKSH